ncbi:hypothetical protein N7468_003705 [Penicillium chermesinum]|uniref:Uncharacterized protein n=1 Tax=Penicillium chermesinum TaxID=63820 RepID=A0A9W9P6W1_9EURO|nr:uncharacterized protein N7468_003705 [Penicillium chermesinum]KAJ5239086.1 hypothetical protein N7468_003705 [Penicillium chermesinum]KAJ6164726.1 hypothetical protein N7470_003398 [Penicillium chermesinum]
MQFVDVPSDFEGEGCCHNLLFLVFNQRLALTRPDTYFVLDAQMALVSHIIRMSPVVQLVKPPYPIQTMPCRRFSIQRKTTKPVC